MYKFVNRDEGSSVYSAVSEILQSRPDWTRINPKSERFNLILAERNRPAYARLGASQVINYYRGSSKLLCRKVSLVRTIRSIRSISDTSGLSPYRWMPLSFVIVPASITQQSQAQAKKYNATAIVRDERDNFLEVCKASNDRNIWIGKSNAGAKGESIFISSDPQEILESIDGEHQAYVIQKYIEDPLLLDGQRKFDIRVWVLLDHLYNIYMFSEGVLRTSSEPYDINNLSNKTSHLTNHCIQEAYSQNFGQYERGNEMFFGDFERFLLGRDGIEFKQVIVLQIQSIIKECLMGIKEEISTAGLSYHSFQLFGFDFMIDQKYKVWLLEINGAPASASDLLPSLSRQIVTVAIDPLFPPKDVPEQKDEMLGAFVQIK